MSAFKPGDVVYSINGETMEYVTVTHDGHIVRPLQEYEDSEPFTGLPELHARIFAEPPTTRYAADTAQAKEELFAAQEELRSVEDALRTAKAERDSILAKVGKHPDLSVVIDWMEGRLTHLAKIEYYGIQIMTIKEAITPRDNSDARNGKVRLLALYGGYCGTEGNKNRYQDHLRWQLSAYSDGSDRTNTMCVLGTSEDDVKARLQKWLDAEFQKRGVNDESTLVRYADAAMTLGLNVPAAYAEMVQKERAKGLQNRMANAERDLKNAQESLVRSQQKLAEVKAECGQEASA